MLSTIPAPLRGLRFWTVLHKWTSLACTAFLVLLCVTGLPLIFTDEIEALSAERALLPPLASGEQAVSIDRLVALARARYPTEVVRFVFIDDDEPVVKVVMAPADSPNRRLDHRIELDARNAVVLKDEAATPRRAGLMDIIRHLHTDLYAGSVGEYLLAGVGLLFVLAALSGVVLYSPYMKKLAFGEVRTRARRLAWLDRHNLIGICTLAWALVVGITGIFNELSKPLSAYWRGTEMSALLKAYRGQPVPVQPGITPPTMTPPAAAQPNATRPGAPQPGPAPTGIALRSSAQSAHDTVRRALPGRNVTSIIFPSQSFSNPQHYLIWTNGNTPLTYRLFTAALVDAQDGKLTAVAQMPLYLRLLQVSRPLHFGDYGGLPLKLLWAALDLATIALLLSGLYLWLARGRAGRARNARLAAST